MAREVQQREIAEYHRAVSVTRARRAAARAELVRIQSAESALRAKRRMITQTLDDLAAEEECVDGLLQERLDEPPPYDVFKTLPDELVMMIFKFVGHAELYYKARGDLVCRRFYHLMQPHKRAARRHVLLNGPFGVHGVPYEPSPTKWRITLLTAAAKNLLALAQCTKGRPRGYPTAVAAAVGSNGVMASVWMRNTTNPPSHAMLAVGDMTNTLSRVHKIRIPGFISVWSVAFHPVLDNMVAVLSGAKDCFCLTVIDLKTGDRHTVKRINARLRTRLRIRPQGLCFSTASQHYSF